MLLDHPKVGVAPKVKAAVANVNPRIILSIFDIRLSTWGTIVHHAVHRRWSIDEVEVESGSSGSGARCTLHMVE